MNDRPPTIRFRRLKPDVDTDIPLPKYMTPQASGMDVFAAVAGSVVLEPGKIDLIPTGFAMALPQGFEAQVRPRSGLAVKHGIGIINSPGTIDSDYRGEVMIAVINFSRRSYTIKRGDRIAQLVINKIYQAETKEVDQLDETARNTGGFGHTGF